MFVQAALHQLTFGIDSTIQMVKQFTYDELQHRPIKNKRSLFEIYIHLSCICYADLLTLNGASKEELNKFYSQHTPHTLQKFSRQWKAVSIFLPKPFKYTP